jgi:hypothetical protein
MDSRQQAVSLKVTYIETQFVTYDAAGFKDLVQRLTGRPHTGGDAAAPPHRPCACRTTGGVGVTTPTVTGAVAWSQGYHHYWRPTTSQKKRVVVSAGGVAARRSISSPTLSTHARSRLPHRPSARVKKERAGERKVAYRDKSATEMVDAVREVLVDGDACLHTLTSRHQASASRRRLGCRRAA